MGRCRVFAHWPDDYHAPEHPPEDQSWGWLIVLAVAALATLAGVVIGWPAAIAVIVVAAALVLAPSRAPAPVLHRLWRTLGTNDNGGIRRAVRG